MPEKFAHVFFYDIQNSFRHFVTPQEESSALLTEIIDPRDLKLSSKKMLYAKINDIKGALELGTFKVILCEEI